MTETQDKIAKIVAQYRAIFPQEYMDVAQIAKQERLSQRTKFAEMPKGSATKGGGTPYVERALIKWPLTLYNLLNMKLVDEEKSYLFSDKDRRGIRWFAKKYPEFRIADKI